MLGGKGLSSLKGDVADGAERRARREIHPLELEAMKRKAIALLERVSRYVSGFMLGGAVEVIKDYNDEYCLLTIKIKLDPDKPLKLKLIYGEREY